MKGIVKVDVFVASAPGSPSSRRSRTARAISWSRSSATRAGTPAPRSASGAAARGGRRGGAAGSARLSGRPARGARGSAREPEVARAPRDPGPVEMLCERDRVLPRSPEPFAERAHRDAVRAGLANDRPSAFDELAGEHELGEIGPGRPNAPPLPRRRWRRRSRGARRSTAVWARRSERPPPPGRPRRRIRRGGTRAAPGRPPGRPCPRTRAGRPRRRRARDRAALPRRRTRPRSSDASSRCSPRRGGLRGVERGEPRRDLRADLVRQVPLDPPPAQANGAVDDVGHGAEDRPEVVAPHGPPFGDQERRQLGARRARTRAETACRVRARATRRIGVEDDAAGDRSAPPRLAKDEPIADVEDERLGERDPDEGALGRHLPDVVEADPRVGRAGVQLEGAARRDRAVERSDGLDPRLERRRGHPHAGRGQDLAPRDARAVGGEVDRDPRDRRRGRDASVVSLETSDPRPGPRRQQLDLLAVARGPPVSVPVTTVPEPLIENTRSTCRRGRPPRSGSGAAASIASSAPTSSSNPSPVVDEHATIGAPPGPCPGRARPPRSGRGPDRRPRRDRAW